MRKVHFQTGPLSTACCPETANVKHWPLRKTPNVADVTCARCQQTETYASAAPVAALCDGCDQMLPVVRIQVRFEDGTPDTACDYCADCAAIVRSGNAFGVAPLTAQQESK